jgi:hypothetical protein
MTAAPKKTKNATISVGGRVLDVSEPTGRLVAADAIQEEGGAKADARAELLRELAGEAWPAGVDESHRFDNVLLLRVASEYNRTVERWYRENRNVRIAELVPGVVGLVGRDLARVIRTRDVGRVLADYLAGQIRDKVSRIIQTWGPDSQWAAAFRFPDEPEVAADLEALASVTARD